ncbi:uncharacterized protein [Dysidea avara]|uniref:uncharacterized protein n=1 Tax=Dysidea avara TaxID=196820 RepID=UPI0033210293
MLTMLRSTVCHLIRSVHTFQPRVLLISYFVDVPLMVELMMLCGKISEDQSPEDAEDGPPELLMGHTNNSNKPTHIWWMLTMLRLSPLLTWTSSDKHPKNTLPYMGCQW